MIDAGPPAWCNRYVGIPFVSRGRDRLGCDCYGLVALVLREQFAIEVPSYANDYPDALEQLEVAWLISNEISRQRWQRLNVPLPIDGERSSALPGSVILLRIAGQPWHVGIVVADGWFLHVRPATDSCLERYDSLRWHRRIQGFYRYNPSPYPSS
jgi:cell wall-associated NlpC family hydrolase